MTQTATQPFPLPAIGSCAHNQPLPMVEGTLTKLYGRKSGESEHGPWSIQNGVLSAEGVHVPVQIKDRDELSEGAWKNQKVRIIASTAKGIQGVYAIDDTRGDTTTRKIKVTPSATIELAGSGAPANQPQQTPAQSAPPADAGAAGGSDPDWPDAPPPQQPAQQEHQGCPGVPKETKKLLLQAANMHLLCQLAVQRYEAPMIQELTGRPMDTAQIQGATASLFIKMDRADTIHTMPARPLTKEELAAPEH